MFPARFGIGQFNRFAFLERARDRSDLSGQFLGDFRGRSLRLKEFRICENRAQQMLTCGLSMFAFVNSWVSYAVPLKFVRMT